MTGDKSQFVRVVDVVAIGPLLIAAGRKNKRLGANAKTLLVITGIATILYNGANFVAKSNVVNGVNGRVQ